MCVVSRRRLCDVKLGAGCGGGIVSEKAASGAWCQWPMRAQHARHAAGCRCVVGSNPVVLVAVSSSHHLSLSPSRPCAPHYHPTQARRRPKAAQSVRPGDGCCLVLHLGLTPRGTRGKGALQTVGATPIHACGRARCAPSSAARAPDHAAGGWCRVYHACFKVRRLRKKPSYGWLHACTWRARACKQVSTARAPT